MTSKLDGDSKNGTSLSSLVWYLLGALLVGLVMLFAVDHLRGLHFGAWEAHKTRESTEGLARNLRGPIMGWFDELGLVIGLLAGVVLSAAAIAGRWKPLAGFFGAGLVGLVLIELTQSAGQERAVPDDVNVVPIVSLILIGALLALPVVSGLAAGNGWRKETT